jgi:hypothetical protein
MAKILSDKYGLYVKIDGYICRPSDPTAFREGDSVRGTHPAGPVAYLRVGQKGTSGYISETWPIIQMARGYKTFLSLKMSDVLPDHKSGITKAFFMAQYFPKSIHLPELLDEHVLKMRYPEYFGMTVAHAVVNFRGTPEELRYIVSKPEVLSLTDTRGYTVAHVVQSKLTDMLRRMADKASPLYSEYQTCLAGVARFISGGK